jgi:hypothetical protein
MDRDRINDIIDTIMINDGPDGHCDGSGLITSFILALLEGRGEEWFKKYKNTPDEPKSALTKQGAAKLEKLIAKHDSKK